MSALTERSRRATAGKRMTDLVGKALEDDEEFWGHDTWAEDDSGNESFSDNDSEAKVDQFDSDFNDSESDHEEDERAAGAAEEMEISREDRNSRKRGGYVEKGGALKKRRIGRRVMGDGLNAGLVLNIPGQAVAPPVIVRPQTMAKPQPQIAARPKRIKKEPPTLRTRSTGTITGAATKKRQSASASGANRKKRERFTQEQLLVEAANETEPANHRWLLARKRIQDQKEVETLEPQEKKNVVETYTSRRGALNTVHFWDMDRIPSILAQRAGPQLPERVLCAITGRPAKYKDPKTGLGYFDAASFKELRRRHAVGELPSEKESKVGTKSETGDNRQQKSSSNGKSTKGNRKRKAPPSELPSKSNQPQPESNETQAKTAQIQPNLGADHQPLTIESPGKILLQSREDIKKTMTAQEATSGLESPGSPQRKRKPSAKLRENEPS